MVAVNGSRLVEIPVAEIFSVRLRRIAHLARVSKTVNSRQSKILMQSVIYEATHATQLSNRGDGGAPPGMDLFLFFLS